MIRVAAAGRLLSDEHQAPVRRRPHAHVLTPQRRIGPVAGISEVSAGDGLQSGVPVQMPRLHRLGVVRQPLVQHPGGCRARTEFVLGMGQGMHGHS